MHVVVSFRDRVNEVRDRKAISVAMDLCDPRVLEVLASPRSSEVCRRAALAAVPTKPRFLAYVLSLDHVRLLLRLIGKLKRPRFRRSLYRALVLMLYCTGIRFGEALRLRIRDLDLRRRVLFVADSKGRSRWVPFHTSLASEFERYLRAWDALFGINVGSTQRVRLIFATASRVAAT
jgi:integrase